MVRAHGGLKAAAVTLFKIAKDLWWFGSGPRTGIHELVLPSNEPGSSIMPGKVNPTQAEAMVMVCIQVISSDLVPRQATFARLRIQHFPCGGEAFRPRNRAKVPGGSTSYDHGGSGGEFRAERLPARAYKQLSAFGPNNRPICATISATSWSKVPN